MAGRIATIKLWLFKAAGFYEEPFPQIYSLYLLFCIAPPRGLCIIFKTLKNKNYIICCFMDNYGLSQL